MSADLSIGFLGAGKMATALARGFVQAGIVKAEAIVASDVYPAAREAFGESVGARTVKSNAEVAQAAKVLFIAVKPDQVAGALSSIREEFTGEHLLISIAAGVTIKQLESGLSDGARVIRVMPNTPALVGESASGFALGSSATEEDGALTEKLLSAVGLALKVKEAQLDAVTGLSGSGPAYVYLMIEAMSDGGVAAGLPRDIATRLAAQTLLGGAKMVLETSQHPGALKDMVTSPGGTTIDGVHELEKAGVRAGLMNAVRTATKKARQLGRRAERAKRKGV
jgi:pyrroline-5-carboxylate reductase